MFHKESWEEMMQSQVLIIEVSQQHSRKKAGSRDPGSGTFLAQIRKVEARLGKLEVRPKKRKKVFAYIWFRN